jgi:hypothetical protein
MTPLKHEKQVVGMLNGHCGQWQKQQPLVYVSKVSVCTIPNLYSGFYFVRLVPFYMSPIMVKVKLHVSFKVIK